MFEPLFADLRALRKKRLNLWPSLPVVIFLSFCLSLLLSENFPYVDELLLFAAVNGSVALTYWSAVRLWNRNVPIPKKQTLFDLGRPLPERPALIKENGPCTYEWYMRTMDAPVDH